MQTWQFLYLLFNEYIKFKNWTFWNQTFGNLTFCKPDVLQTGHLFFIILVGCCNLLRVGELPAGGGGLHPVRRHQAVPGGPPGGIHPEPAEAARGSSSGGWRGRPPHPTLLRLHRHQGGQLETMSISKMGELPPEKRHIHRTPGRQGAPPG